MGLFSVRILIDQAGNPRLFLGTETIRCARPAPSEIKHDAGKAEQQQGGRADPEQVVRGCHARPQQDEIAIARDQEVEDLRELPALDRPGRRVLVGASSLAPNFPLPTAEVEGYRWKILHQEGRGASSPLLRRWRSRCGKENDPSSCQMGKLVAVFEPSSARFDPVADGGFAVPSRLAGVCTERKPPPQEC